MVLLILHSFFKDSSTCKYNWTTATCRMYFSFEIVGSQKHQGDIRLYTEMGISRGNPQTPTRNGVLGFVLNPQACPFSISAICLEPASLQCSLSCGANFIYTPHEPFITCRPHAGCKGMPVLHSWTSDISAFNYNNFARKYAPKPQVLCLQHYFIWACVFAVECTEMILRLSTS